MADNWNDAYCAQLRELSLGMDADERVEVRFIRNHAPGKLRQMLWGQVLDLLDGEDDDLVVQWRPLFQLGGKDELAARDDLRW